MHSKSVVSLLKGALESEYFYTTLINICNEPMHMKRTLKKFYLKFSYNPLDQQKCSVIVDVVVVFVFLELLF